MNITLAQVRWALCIIGKHVSGGQVTSLYTKSSVATDAHSHLEDAIWCFTVSTTPMLTHRGET